MCAASAAVADSSGVRAHALSALCATSPPASSPGRELLDIAPVGRFASPAMSVDQLQAYIRLVATVAGDFVEQIRIDDWQPCSPGWQRWTVADLPGPPAAFPSM